MPTKEQKKEFKNKLDKLFLSLGKKGYFARQNFWCCQNCAWSAMNDKQAKKAVFYHNQDNDDIREHGYVYLAWSGGGKTIKTLVEKAGFYVEWDGSKDTRICLRLEKPE